MPDDYFTLSTTFTTTGSFDLAGQPYQPVPPAPPPLVAFATLNLWNEFRYWQANAYAQSRDVFVEWLKAKVTDPDNVEVNWCDRCSMPTSEDLTDVQGQEVCPYCIRDYVRRCENCEELCIPNCTYAGEPWCGGCSNDHLRYCDHCGFYYRLDDDEHMHRNTPCECPPPTYEVRLRRVEKKRLIREDTKVVVNLPDGHISAVGLNEIRVYLQLYGNTLRAQGEGHWIAYVKLSMMLGEIGSQWQTTRGNFTKRLTSFAYKTYGLKVDPEVITQVGNIARAQSHGLSTKVSFTRDLNQGRSAFVHTGSCWWSDYNSSRCILKSNGGFAMRTWNNSPRSRATGRAWVLPMDYENGRWVPTFDTLTPTGFVVFNGYGDLEDYAPARIMSEITGLPYRKINFDDEEMYVNNESGYLLAPDDITTSSINTELPRLPSKRDRRRAARVRAAFDPDALIRVCQMGEREFADRYDMEVWDCEQRWPADQFYFRDNGSNILAVAHLDTVVDEIDRSTFITDSADGPVVLSGALDDRLGAYIILEMLPRLGIKVDWLLTLGEEVGQSTAEFFKAEKDYNWMIEFDRGGTDVVMYDYETTFIANLVRGCGARVGHGSFSDIAYLEHIGVKAFNWGVGYEDYHSVRGHAFLNDTFSMVTKFLRFHATNHRTKLPHKKRKPGKNKSYSYGGGSGYAYGGWSDGRWKDWDEEWDEREKKRRVTGGVDRWNPDTKKWEKIETSNIHDSAFADANDDNDEAALPLLNDADQDEHPWDRETKGDEVRQGGFGFDSGHDGNVVRELNAGSGS